MLIAERDAVSPHRVSSGTGRWWGRRASFLWEGAASQFTPQSPTRNGSPNTAHESVGYASVAFLCLATRPRTTALYGNASHLFIDCRSVIVSRRKRHARPKAICGAMSRPGGSAARNLTLTEELEKLEQSITLTLQGTAKMSLTMTKRVDRLTQDRRDRPQLQQSSPHRHIQHSPHRRAICRAFTQCLGGLKGSEGDLYDDKAIAV